MSSSQQEVRSYAGLRCVHYKYADCSSTNEQALSLLESGVQAGQTDHAVIVRAEFQHSGRGTHGRQWQGNAHENLYLSIALAAPSWSLVYTDYQFLACLAVYDALHSVMDPITLHLKYPNDILSSYQGSLRKLSGILVETEFRAQHLSACVCGIGVNCNQELFAADTQTGQTTALSIKQAMGHDVSIEDLEDCICNNFFNMMNVPADLVYQRWRDTLHLVGKELLHRDRNERFVVRDIERNGMLLLSDAKGTCTRVDSLRSFELCSY